MYLKYKKDKKKYEKICCIGSANTTYSLVSFFLILLASTSVSAQVDSYRDKDLEKRLHSIYKSSYSKPVSPELWSKFTDSLGEQTYVVQKGDTLWGISEVFFGDGFFWSKLWAQNSGITNPHLLSIGDKIYFYSGSDSEGPKVSVDKPPMGTDKDSVQQEIASQLSDISSKGTAEVTSPVEKAGDISPLFLDSQSFINGGNPNQGTQIEKRPKPQVNIKFPLMREAFAEKPDSVGHIHSLGIHREISGESNLFILKSSESLEVGEGIIVMEVSKITGGYGVEVIAEAKILAPLKGDYYKAIVLNQYGALLEKQKVSSAFKVKSASLAVGSLVSSKKATLVRNKDHYFFGEGQIVYLKELSDELAVGDILKTSNEHTRDYEVHIPAGLIKVVSTSSPLATGIVLNSQHELSAGSVTGM